MGCCSSAVPLNEDELWEKAQKKPCLNAVNYIRGVIPPEIFTITKEAAEELGVPDEICQRIFNKRILWLVRMDVEDISKIHAAELNEKYSNQGLDIREMRAVYGVLPPMFGFDGDGKKEVWRANIIHSKFCISCILQNFPPSC
jgi:hypothetical protein